MTSSEILDMVDEGILDARDALNAALQYLSTDDVADLAVTNGWDDDIFDEDIGEDDDEYEDDEGENFEFDPEEMKDKARSAIDNWMSKKDEDVYYDPTDGYRDTEGLHNSIEEAEDDYYENDYKVNIPEEE